MKQQWIERPEAGTVWGYKLISAFARLCGRSAARLVLYPITLYFLIRRGPERRASRAYLERVTGKPARLPQIARHILWFASVILDRAFLLSGRRAGYQIEVQGLETVSSILNRGQCCVLLGAPG